MNKQTKLALSGVVVVGGLVLLAQRFKKNPEFNPYGKPVKVFGPAMLVQPVEFVTAANQMEQVVALYNAWHQSNPRRLERWLKKLFNL